jgi:hypothetical protein
MKYFLSIFFLSFCLTTLSAQEKHFVFIQSENNQPFYVLINGKLHSSTAGGYVIIPKLPDGDYNCSIGFAQNSIPEQSFQFTISKKDLGFNLKNFGEKGLGLFNLQSLSVTMAGASPSNDVAKALKEAALAKENAEAVISFDRKKKENRLVTDQTKRSADSLASQPGPVANELLSEVTKPNATVTATEADKSTLQTPAAANTTVRSEGSAPEAASRTDVKKVSEVKAAEGVSLSYTDKNGKVTDTVNIIIPSAKAKTTSETVALSDTTIAANSNTVIASNSNSSKTSANNKQGFKFLDVDMNVPKTDAVQRGGSKQSAISSIPANSYCNNIATDDDYARLRKKMAGETSDEKMISEAKKVYRNKCFTTSQIKALSTLFMSDEGRFKFFEASLVSVADTQQYLTLQSEFVDPAFVNRFKALIP